MLKPTSPIVIDSKYIENVNFSGLRGRIITLPALGKNKHPIVLIGGQHSAHERMLPFALFLQDYGTVYMIDIPGFGGMTGFQDIGKKIEFDSYAEYLYSTLKSRKLTKDVSIFAVSVGSQYVTRMLQKYPETEKWIDKYIAFVGFGADKDFNVKPAWKTLYTVAAKVCGSRIGAFFVWLVFLNRLSLIPMMTIFGFFKSKMQSEDPKTKRQMKQMETYLWHVNDIQTHGISTSLVFNEDLRKYSDRPIGVTLHNITTNDDQYLNVKEVRKTFRDLFVNYQEHEAQLGVHMPSMLSDKEEVAAMFSKETVKEVLG